MKSALAVTLLFASAALAHPGVGIVVDARGDVFYTDLHHVWVLAPDGTKRIAVPNVHTHEICLDSAGNLYGEHLWYKGERLDTWGSRVWRRSPDGAMTDVVPAHPGFTENHSFVRTRREPWTGPTGRRRRSGAARRTAPSLARANFRDVRWSTVTLAGTVS